jgi:rhamnogalacturonan endolyase
LCAANAARTSSCSRSDGRLLYRVDLGVNIRAGAHYTQFLMYDFDGDGRSELMRAPT